VHIKSNPQRQKTISLKVINSGLHINTPIRYNQDIFEKFIQKKHPWILEHWLKFKKLNIKKEFVSGESLPYKGKRYRLKTIKKINQKCKIDFSHSRFFCYVDKNSNLQKEEIKLALIQWYQNKAYDVIVDEARSLIKKYNFPDVKIVIKDFKTLYGKCK